MTTVYDIPAEMLIRQVAEELKKNPQIQPPDWAAFAKTGVHREMPPENEDWWYVRAAAIFRRIYTDGPVGIQRMRSAYGGKRDRGSAPNQFRRGSGSIVRKVFQQLEAAGYVSHTTEGRVVTPAGRSFLDNVANSLKAQAAETAPGLARY
ncbi:MULTISPECIES: 30S ribosomal protein S19e [Methanoculleus]|mgnify:CR=1 FL=1|jgi:small subunit ribosomal protein S19e|uniref:Small ribosomal subunit protein eS19 n=1 Tax=Methanoculleus thermophilus TaxID=2200 RepID=A0A1G8XCC9_9EURY|nr:MULTISPECIES: 30S ribosomal protein S19e [Methanoculleus]NLN09432.1 30S ribosomal protein S19e [Methanoculleus thermophilus]SDJ87420.1 small subunit ribosomal protein S19e [Methanoculleus thermophilus]HQD25118.1 30S ribosomal protein S19e [Methanoculleus thermophilus]